MSNDLAQMLRDANAEVEELRNLVILYQSEGEDEIPEEAEWRQIVSQTMTPELKKRAAQLARTIQQQCNATWLREKNKELKNLLRECDNRGTNPNSPRR